MSDSLKQLIRQYPELGDVFADFETRLLFLENSQPLKFPEEPADKPQAKPQLVEKWTKSQWHKVLGVELEMERLRRTTYKYLKEMRELMANASKRKPRSKY